MFSVIQRVEKLAGLALIHTNTLAIINDDNFGMGSSTVSNGQLVGATVPYGSFQQNYSLEMGAWDDLPDPAARSHYLHADCSLKFV